jgi:hypothetical protein
MEYIVHVLIVVEHKLFIPILVFLLQDVYVRIVDVILVSQNIINNNRKPIMKIEIQNQEKNIKVYKEIVKIANHCAKQKDYERSDRFKDFAQQFKDVFLPEYEEKK